MKKRNYPETRKPRDTSYAKCTQLEKKHGQEIIKQVWQDRGMYRAARYFNTTPGIIQHLAKKYGWQRPASKAPTHWVAVQDGTADSEKYQCLDFTR